MVTNFLSGSQVDSILICLFWHFANNKILLKIWKPTIWEETWKRNQQYIGLYIYEWYLMVFNLGENLTDHVFKKALWSRRGPYSVVLVKHLQMCTDSMGSWKNLITRRLPGYSNTLIKRTRKKKDFRWWNLPLPHQLVNPKMFVYVAIRDCIVCIGLDVLT